MKRHIRRAILFLLVLGTLSACRIYGIFSTADPALGLITEQTDLAAAIPAAAANSFTLSVVEDYGKEYVVLASDVAYEGTHLWLMDANLNVLQTLTYADLGGSAFSGSRVWFDAWDKPPLPPPPHRILVGNILFGLTADQLALPGSMIPSGQGQQFFSIRTGGNFDIAHIYAAGNTLNLSLYDDTWNVHLAKPNMAVIIGPASAYSLLAVFSDPHATDTAHTAAFFVFRDMDTGTDHFVKVPWAHIMGTTSTPLLSNYELFSKPSASDRPEFLGYAADSFFSYSQESGNAGDFIRFDQTGAVLPGSLHFEKLPDMQVAYSLSGTHYFTFDRTTRVLSRRAAWW